MSLESAGLLHSLRQATFGLSLIFSFGGMLVIWDVAPLADSYINSFFTAGNAAELATNRKCEKCAGSSSSYSFQPIACETLAALNITTVDFLSEFSYNFE